VQRAEGAYFSSSALPMPGTTDLGVFRQMGVAVPATPDFVSLSSILAAPRGVDDSNTGGGFEDRKAPDDVEHPKDQPSGGYRQDVPPVKPGMGPEVSPDESNSEVDRSDYSTPGTNPDVPGNRQSEDYRPSPEAKADLRYQKETGKGRVPGKQRAYAAGFSSLHMTPQMLSGIQNPLASHFSRAAFTTSAYQAAKQGQKPVHDSENVGRDTSAGGVHPHLPNSDHAVDASEAAVPTKAGVNEDLMSDDSLANKPRKDKKKKGEVVDQSFAHMKPGAASDADVPSRKRGKKAKGDADQPQDVAPEQAGS